jgi:hypothetical protein
MDPKFVQIYYPATATSRPTAMFGPDPDHLRLYARITPSSHARLTGVVTRLVIQGQVIVFPSMYGWGASTTKGRG